MGLTDAWYRRAGWLHLLRPLAALFGWLASRRRRRLQRNQTSLPLPVIVVGNITVGGTGKTPVVLALTESLRAAGYRPGIVSRGYRARPGSLPHRVSLHDAPDLAGDEPLLLARRAGVPVVVDPDRCRAVRELAAHGDCDVIISDDGLQHYAMPRCMEIVMVDGERGLGNGLLLPAGPMREPADRLMQVDAVLVNGEPTKAVRRQLRDSDWKAVRLVCTAWVNLKDGRRVAPRALEVDDGLYAVAGIGHPDRFFAVLRSLGYRFQSRPFADHHAFRKEDLAFASKGTVVMTEKDAVKCAGFAQADWWYMEVSAELPESLLETIRGRLPDRAVPGNESLR
ncbi:MAG: tetraacyldisaccharide 4'-kinase [Pseudomonadota bacterium]